ncbi:MAG: FxsA family protein [Myxococcales bacterium]|nr:FxsA family protein [Myxococcales bacterium]
MRYVVLFFAAIAAEIASVVIAADLIGWWTLAALVGAVGLGVVVLTGRGVMIVRDVTAALGAGSSPTPAIVDGALAAVAWVLLITPGFASDAVALALLLPPVRALVRDRLIARVRTGLEANGVVTGGGFGGVGPDGAIDVDGVEVRVEPPPRPTLPDALN